MIEEIQLLVTFKKIQSLQKNSHCVSFLNVCFSFFPEILHHFFIIVLLHICKVQSSNLISSVSVQMPASLYNCARGKMGGNIRLGIEEDHFCLGLITFGLQVSGLDP